MKFKDEKQETRYWHYFGGMGGEIVKPIPYQIEGTTNVDGHNYGNLDIICVNNQILDTDLNFIEAIPKIYGIVEVKTTYDLKKEVFKMNGCCAETMCILSSFGIPICIAIIRIKKKLPIQIVEDETYERMKQYIKNQIRIEFYPQGYYEITYECGGYIYTKKENAIILEDFGGKKPKLTKKQKQLVKYGKLPRYKPKEYTEKESLYFFKLYQADYFSLDHWMDDAIDTYLEAISIEPNRPEAYIGIAGSPLSYDERHEDAMECINRAIELDPKNPESYWIKSMIYSNMNKMNMSKFWCEKGLEINPNSKILKEFLNEVNDILRCREKAIPEHRGVF